MRWTSKNTTRSPSFSGAPSTAAKHVVERFTLAPDRKHLDYEAVVEDPEYLAAPVSHRAQWDYRPDQQPSNLPCETDVARRFAEGVDDEQDDGDEDEPGDVDNGDEEDQDNEQEDDGGDGGGDGGGDDDSGGGEDDDDNDEKSGKHG